MAQRIIYPLPNGDVAFISPAESIDLTIEQIAQKDVPAGVPYFIVDETDLPPISTQSGWVVDFSQPHGFGVGHDEWAAANSALLIPSQNIQTFDDGDEQ